MAVNKPILRAQPKGEVCLASWGTFNQLHVGAQKDTAAANKKNLRLGFYSLIVEW